MRVTTYVLLALTLVSAPCLFSQTSPTEQVQIAPPPPRRADPPDDSATGEDLEKHADQLRADKAYLDALDYYRAAIKKQPDRAVLYNKLGITELLMQRYRDARKDCERALKLDRRYPDAYNNLGVTYYLERKYGKAIHQYEKAIALKPDTASYFSNLGAAYFAKKDFEKAIPAYAEAIRLDPEIFDRTSHAGVAAQMSSPEDRSHFQYVLAKLYAKNGDYDRALQCLRRAMEDGYKDIEDVYKDAEFTALRKDPRFAELMQSRPLAISE
ncbi:MAG: tetratricopeptide repeat protein [Acidobacteria bacterium]|nr:tetratricopeptide repeat protein [Acidobacteriota bacterium]